MSLSSILRRGPLRFAVLIAFIILAAALARLADLTTGWILAVIALAWLLAALIERSAHRAAVTAKDAWSGGAPAGAAPPAARPRPAVSDEADRWLDDDTEIDPGPAPGMTWSRPVRAAVPEPAPEPVLPPPPRLVASSSLPQGSWNLWELESMARDVAGADPARDEERSLILMYLRGFASAEGVLGLEFDDLIRESFGDLLPPR